MHHYSNSLKRFNTSHTGIFYRFFAIDSRILLNSNQTNTRKQRSLRSIVLHTWSCVTKGPVSLHIAISLQYRFSEEILRGINDSSIRNYPNGDCEVSNIDNIIVVVQSQKVTCVFTIKIHPREDSDPPRNMRTHRTQLHQPAPDGLHVFALKYADPCAHRPA